MLIQSARLIKLTALAGISLVVGLLYGKRTTRLAEEWEERYLLDLTKGLLLEMRGREVTLKELTGAIGGLRSRTPLPHAGRETRFILKLLGDASFPRWNDSLLAMHLMMRLEEEGLAVHPAPNGIPIPDRELRWVLTEEGTKVASNL